MKVVFVVLRPSTGGKVAIQLDHLVAVRENAGRTFVTFGDNEIAVVETFTEIVEQIKQAVEPRA